MTDMQVQSVSRKKTEKKTYAPREIPRRKGKLVGSTIDFQSDQLNFVQQIHEEYGDVVVTRIANLDWYFVRDPEIIHEINVRQAKLFVKPKLAKTIWKLFLGNGILTADGPDWKRQHNLIKPGFHRKRIEAYSPLMIDYAERMIETFADGDQRDMREEFNTLALRIMGKTLFDADMSASKSVLPMMRSARVLNSSRMSRCSSSAKVSIMRSA